MPISFPLLSIGTAPTDGVSEVQLLTPDSASDAGDFTLTYDGEETDPITFDATIEDIQAALEALSNIGAGNVVCSGDDPETPTQIGDGGVITVTFANALGGLDVSELTANSSLTLSAVPVDITPSTDTPGERGTYRGAQGGALLEDTADGVLYVNSGSAAVPVWTDMSDLVE